MRRVVIGRLPDGGSTLAADGTPPALFHFRDQSDPHVASAYAVDDIPDLAEGEGVLAELWATDGVPSPAMDGDPTTVNGWRVECPPGSTRFRTSVFSPGRTTAMHTTTTLDYDFVLEGSVTLLLSDGSEIDLVAGDAVVIPAAAHAWRAGPKGCRLGLVMVGVDSGAD